MTPKQEKRLAEDYARMYVALRRIAAYQTVERIHRSSQKDWGLPAHECVEMAYENVIGEAKFALKGLVKPIQRGAQTEVKEG